MEFEPIQVYIKYIRFQYQHLVSKTSTYEDLSTHVICLLATCFHNVECALHSSKCHFINHLYLDASLTKFCAIKSDKILQNMHATSNKSHLQYSLKFQTLKIFQRYYALKFFTKNRSFQICQFINCFKNLITLQLYSQPQCLKIYKKYSTYFILPVRKQQSLCQYTFCLLIQKHSQLA